MKTNLELLIMIIYTTHALPIRNPAESAQNGRKDSADTSPKSAPLSDQSLKQLRLNFFIDPSSEIKKLNTTGRSRIKDATNVMQLTDSQIRQIKENYNSNLTNTEIKIQEPEEINSVHKGILGRSKNHNEPTSHIYIWSSNALTDEQWETIQNNVQENENEIKFVYDIEKDIEKYDNHTSKNADGRHRPINAENVIEEPKYYSFSNSQWEELKKTLHEHLTGEDEKILKVNEDLNGRNRNEKVQPPNLPKWSIWSSYALKPSEWDQLKQNIHHNEFIMNKTKNNIDLVGRGRSNEGNSSIASYDAFSGEDHINAVIVKPVTGERLYNLRKTFDWDGLLESISSNDIITTDEGKEVTSIVDGSVGYNNQSNDKNENPINESQMGRSRKMGRQHQVIGIMPSLVLDDENIPNFEDTGSGPLFIEKYINVGVDENNSDSNKNTIISIEENDLNIQNTDKTATNFESDSPDSELKDKVNTFTPSIHLTEDILDYGTTTPLQLKPNSSRENYIFQQSVESDISANNIAYETSITEKYVAESGGYENTTRENYIFQQSVVSDNSLNIKSYDTTDTENYITTESAGGYENTTRENYIFQQSVVSDNSLNIKSYDTTDTENYNTTESAEFYNSTRETYIKIKPVTDSTEIMDFSTLTQNKDSNIHDNTIINDTFTVNALNIDVTQYTNYDLATEQDYSINKNELENTPINDNTTTEVYIINLSENDIVVSTAKVMNFKENKSDLYHDSTNSLGNETTTSTFDTIYLIDTDGNSELKTSSVINLSEFVTTEDKGTLITETFSPDTLNNITDSLLENYNSPSMQNDISTVSQAYESTTEGKSFGLFGFFGFFDESNSKITTINGFNDLAMNENNISVMDPGTTTVIIDDDGYVVKESRFDIPEDILLTTEGFLGNKDTSLILEKETSLENKDPTLSLSSDAIMMDEENKDPTLSLSSDAIMMDEENKDPTLRLSSDAIMMDEEIILSTTDHMDNISVYYSTTNSEELAAVLLNSDPVPTSIEHPLSDNDSLSTDDLEMNKATTNLDFAIEKTTLNNLNASDLGEMASSDVMITTVDISAEETSSSTVQIHYYDLNISSDVDNQSEDPKNENETLDTTFIPSSSAGVSENMSIKSSEILSTTQDMEPNEVEIYSAKEKLPNEVPNQPQELVGNEIPIISTTARPTTIELTPVEPVSNIMPTWIILLIVLILSLIVLAVGFIIVVRLKRQTGHIQLSP